MARYKYDIHPDFIKFRHLRMPINAFTLPVANAFLTPLFYATRAPKGLGERRLTIAGYENGSVRLSVLRPEGHDKPLPTLVYLHGGAFALQAAPYLKRILFRYALETPCQVVSVDYRLLPRAAFPVGLEDCYAAYKYTLDHAGELYADASRVAIGGDSAGGTLAIGVCFLAKERGLQAPCFQLLVYPGCGGKEPTASMLEYTDVPLWNSRLNEALSRMYYRNGMRMSRKIASPLEAESLAGMPPAYIEVAEFDCLRDGGIEYARRLALDGVKVELYRTKRTIHGYELAEKNEIAVRSVGLRVAALREGMRRSSKRLK